MFGVRSESRMIQPSSPFTNAPWWARASFGAYLVWNVVWLTSGKTPPSILRSLIGLPCPTTGCTRSLVALVHGDLRAALLWNPFTVPILILLSLSLATLLFAALRKRALVLPKLFGFAWLTVLLLAWISKFVLGRAYW